MGGDMKVKEPPHRLQEAAKLPQGSLSTWRSRVPCWKADFVELVGRILTAQDGITERLADGVAPAQGEGSLNRRNGE